jgi:glutamate racemase
MIGVFDSGVGGLTVLSKIRQHCPEVPLTYVADSLFAPYGELSAAKVQERSLRLSQWLLDQGCTLIVVACNTATALAIDHLRDVLPVPIVGVEPGIKPAALNSKTHTIGILATENTVVSQRYRHLMERFLPNVEVLSQGCAGLADAIEQASDNTSVLLKKYTEPMVSNRADHLVLGCTHYPLVQEQLKVLIPDHVIIVDTSEPIAMEVKRRYRNEAGSSDRDGTTRLFVTGNLTRFNEVVGFYESLRWLVETPVECLSL